MSNDRIEGRIEVSGLKDGRSLDQVGEPDVPTPIPITEAAPVIETAPASDAGSGSAGSDSADS